MSSAEFSPELQIRRNLAQLQQEVAEACRRVNREAASVRLIGVTKYAEWPWIELLARFHTDFGENRPQQLVERQQRLPGIRWHLIGQLQRNKVKLVLPHTVLIHSVDSIGLLQRIAVCSAESDLPGPPHILLQVNVSGEDSKSGFSPVEIRRVWSQLLEMAIPGADRPIIQIDGLMTMAPECDDPEQARPWFRLLRELRDELAATPAARNHGIRLPHLSMGMSGDFVPAVEEGATLIRIGSRLFEGLQSASGDQLRSSV